MTRVSPSFELKSTEFRRERERGWRELEVLVAKAESEGLGSLDGDELYRLPVLYRGALSSLSVARSISLDRNVVEYLESLAARAYVLVYGSRRDYLATLRSFFTHRFPRRVWEMRRAVAAAAVTLLLGTLVGYTLTARHPELYYGFVSEDMAQGRSPASTPEELAEVLRDEGEGLATFASFLFTHNAQIGLLCFAVGVAAGVPVLLLLFTNGVVLGAFGALYTRAGLALPFWAWVLPHGLTELLAVCLCGAAGLTLGASLVFPGPYSRLDSLAAAGRRAADVVIGCLALFFVAGLLEGFFRQTVHGEGPRLAMVAFTAIVWALYFLRRGAHGAGGEGP